MIIALNNQAAFASEVWQFFTALKEQKKGREQETEVASRTLRKCMFVKYVSKWQVPGVWIY